MDSKNSISGQGGVETAIPRVKRGRGRPRKILEGMPRVEERKLKIKKNRGRPRKIEKDERCLILIRKETRDKLKKLRQWGEIYDDVIRRLLVRII